MKKLTVILAALALAGCANMTERERNTAMIVGAVLVTGAIVASQADSGSAPAKRNCYWIVTANGSTQYCE